MSTQLTKEDSNVTTCLPSASIVSIYAPSQILLLRTTTKKEVPLVDKASSLANVSPQAVKGKMTSNAPKSNSNVPDSIEVENLDVGKAKKKVLYNISKTRRLPKYIFQAFDFGDLGCPSHIGLPCLLLQREKGKMFHAPPSAYFGDWHHDEHPC